MSVATIGMKAIPRRSSSDNAKQPRNTDDKLIYCPIPVRPRAVIASFLAGIEQTLQGDDRDGVKSKHDQVIGNFNGLNALVGGPAHDDMHTIPMDLCRVSVNVTKMVDIKAR
ncbi:uncharacterized protein SPPG_07942 [Spizellomyces punctatus DAOM BR117]|uniref:Uncharacterized protein n=1 Tax=Spizellomyces punctatus (strain DAOM BR117) TaxID=645134 RepID=A0A0L0H6Z4_SPIPD|nr:hypothetical protein, variant [Spizellomyces punctatus DAOM BR117]XP_016604774.1 uncharacterized protein SPPG_07942 [Spizellomyces punctatus DAOM BR117]KNC96733.1 hypothetical protein, variant [Spizellomyces punctatus DAOM BR117]KNC96734.1 hypothetical protein SPPG_07942 [Spizellomyces punctatus DAOM BR117]|eukprot:XP_016604773.1 hypothetical protein, variant [Spizellomyces punctatus DAOM BR117]